MKVEELKQIHVILVAVRKFNSIVQNMGGGSFNNPNNDIDKLLLSLDKTINNDPHELYDNTIKVYTERGRVHAVKFVKNATGEKLVECVHYVDSVAKSENLKKPEPCIPYTWKED